MLFNAEPQRTRREAQSSCHGGPVVEWDGKPERVILTRRRGDAEISAEKRRSQGEDERGDSRGRWPLVRSGWVSGEKTRTNGAFGLLCAGLCALCGSALNSIYPSCGDCCHLWLSTLFPQPSRGNTARTRSIASSRLRMRPSSCASSSTARICENCGPGWYPIPIRSAPFTRGSGCRCAALYSSNFPLANA